MEDTGGLSSLRTTTACNECRKNKRKVCSDERLWILAELTCGSVMVASQHVAFARKGAGLAHMS